MPSVFDFRPCLNAFNMSSKVSITAWRYDDSEAVYVRGELQANTSLWTQLTLPGGKHTFVPAPKDYVDKLPVGERKRSRKLVWVEGAETLRTIRHFARPDLVRNEDDGLVYQVEDEYPQGKQAGICGAILVLVDDTPTLPNAGP